MKSSFRILKELLNQNDSTELPSYLNRPGHNANGKVVGLLVLLGLIAFLYFQYGDSLTLKSLASRENSFREYQDASPLIVAGVAFLIYVLVTGLSLPGAAVLTLLFGWLFGFWGGTFLASFASTAGATLAFLFSRYLFRSSIQSRFSGKLAGFNQALEQEGAFYLFSLRLIPVIPFFVINLVMGLTPIKTHTFWWVSQLGMLAGTAVYVYAGSSVPSIATLAEKGLKEIISTELLVAFVLLGLLPITMKKIVDWMLVRKSSS